MNSPKCNETDCSICYESLDGKDKKGGYGQLDCGHCFHVECLFEWYDRGNETCPMCRKAFKSSKKANEERLHGGAKAKVKKAVRKVVKK